MSDDMENIADEISLLYPPQDLRDSKNTANVSAYTLDQLEMDSLIKLKNSDIGSFFTDSVDVIEYRQETFQDMLNCPELKEVLKKIIPILSDITELRNLSNDSELSTYGYLYNITEAELYLTLIELLDKEFMPLKDSLKSRAFTMLAKRVNLLTNSDYYSNLNKRLKELTDRVREIKSVTIGVNLDSQLRCDSAGVISINNEKFKSGELIEKLKRLDFKDDVYTCIAPLIPFGKTQNEDKKVAMSRAFNSAINEVFKSSVHEWKKAAQSYVLSNSDFLIRLMPEVELIIRGTELIEKLKECGCKVSFPQMFPIEDKKYTAVGLVNPLIALKTSENLVPNDLTFDENGCVYVLTGPNRGGKSVITCAIGYSFVMAQLGLPVTADSVLLSPCDQIFTHFPTGSEDTIEKGRLGEECSRISHIFDSVTKYSLVLLDEAFSSTGSYEGAIIAAEVIAGLAMVGARTIFSTHLHDLAASVSSINEQYIPKGAVYVDNLVAEMQPDGNRSFKILRKAPDGKSYAKDIAEKYGLSVEMIMSKALKKK